MEMCMLMFFFFLVRRMSFVEQCALGCKKQDKKSKTTMKKSA